jgi:hypothetical protein
MTIIKRRPAGRRSCATSAGSDSRTATRSWRTRGFIGDSPDYVLNQLIETVLAKDREFLAWRGDGGGPGPRAKPARLTRAHPAIAERSPRGARS